jgi:hypothetical protein
MVARTISEAIWESLTTRADPSGQDNAKPLMPSASRQLVLHHRGGSRRVAFSPGMPEFNAIQGVLQADYRRILARSDGSIHRKVLDFWCQKYGIDDERVFIPLDLPRETRLAHETTITDNFTRADGADIGNLLAWTTYAPTLATHFSTASNAVTTTANNGYDKASADTPLSSDDHYSQVVLTATDGGNGCGVLVRNDGSANTSYEAHFITGGNSLSYKCEAGSFTNIGVNTAFTFSNPDTIYISADGSSIVRKLNGTTLDTVTDTAITGNLRAGIMANGVPGGHVLDDFEAADIAAAGGGGAINMLLLGVG